MEPTNVLNTLDTVANILGVPAAMFLGWVYMRVRQLSSEVESLKKAREDDRKDADSKLSEIYSKLNSLASDVSFIRGKLEDYR